MSFAIIRDKYTLSLFGRLARGRIIGRAGDVYLGVPPTLAGTP